MTDPGRSGNAAPTAAVAAMFDRLAGRYDLMNAVVSGFQEPRWRRALVRATELRPGMAAVDVATGTGAVASSLADVVGPAGHVTGVDVSEGMLRLARNRLRGRAGVAIVLGDAMALPLPDEVADGATIAFGMRNLPDYERGFAEMRRVLRPGGVVACLEIGRPTSPVGRLGRMWFEQVVPRIGRLAGHSDAYRYLVSSVRAYPPPERIATIMRDAGLVEVTWRPMLFGMVTLHTGRRPAGGEGRAAGAVGAGGSGAAGALDAGAPEPND